MKKMVLAMAVLGMIAMFGCKEARGEEPAAEFRFPGFGCKDVTLLQEQLALAPDDCMKMTITYHLDFAQNGVPATFADACARIDTAIDAINAEFSAGVRAILKKQYAHCTGKFTSEVVAYCKANPCSYDLHIALADKTEWGYQTVADYMLQYQYPPNYVINAVDYLNLQAIALGKEDAEVFDLLKKLNRVFSARLIEDKEVWGGVVAQIRTMMETYK